MEEIEEIHKLKKIFDTSIYSIVKYGFGKRNLLVVVKETDVDYLLKIKPYILKLKKSKNILLLSNDDLKESNLGIDLLNIMLTSVVIYGNDPFKGFEVDNNRIKRQIKYEANKLLIGLKNELLSRKWSWQMKSLLFSSIPRVLPLIVAHLYLKGEKIPNAIPDTINKYLKHNEDAVVLLKMGNDVSKDEMYKYFDEIFVFLNHLAENFK